jgi:hypothetical protein
MIFFDYLYYKASKFYARYDKDGAGISGLVVVALMQGFNLISAYSAILLILDRHGEMSKLEVIILYVFLLVVNGIRYSRLNKAGLRERWDGESENRRARGNLLMMFYVFLSTALFFGLAIYIGDKYNP